MRTEKQSFRPSLLHSYSAPAVVQQPRPHFWRHDPPSPISPTISEEVSAQFQRLRDQVEEAERRAEAGLFRLAVGAVWHRIKKALCCG